MRKLLYILGLFFICSECFTQTFADKKYYLIDSLDLSLLNQSDKYVLDSCINLYNNAKNDSVKVLALDFISNNLLDDVWIKYNEYLNKKCIEILKKNKSVYYKKIYASSQNNMGYAAENTGEIEKAIGYYFDALKLYEEIKNKEGEAYCLNNLAVLFESQDEYDQALTYHLKSLSLRQELGIDEQIIQTLNNIGAHYYKRNDLKSAIQYYQQSIVIAKKTNDLHNLALVYGNMGNIYLHSDEHDNGIEYFEKSIDIYDELEDAKGAAWGLYNLGNVFLKRKNFKKAIEKFELALARTNTINYAALKLNTYKLLYKTYAKLPNWKKAFEFYQNYNSLDDSINNLETQKLAIKQQTQYEFDKQKVLIDAEHEKQLAIEKEAKAKQKIIIYSTAGGLVLVALFLVFVFNRLQVTRKQKSVIEEQKTVVEKAHHELEEKNKEIMDSITYAKRIQSAILPPTKLVKEYLPQSFILYKPKDIVAGDFYWMETKTGSEWKVEGDENSLHKTHHSPLILFAAADCTGHGVPGAMVSVVCNNGLNRSVREHGLIEPGQILDKTREIVIQEFEKSDEEVKDGMDISLCALDLNNNKLSWSGANNPLWIIRNNEIIEYKADKQPIGKYAESNPFTTHEIQLQKDDSIYIFTDGYQDQFGGEKGKKFKAAKLRELLLSIQHEPMEIQREIIDQSFETWKGSLEQVDDVCVIGVRI